MQRLEDNLAQKSLDLTEEANKCLLYQTDLEKKQVEWQNQREEFSKEKGLLMKEKEVLQQERSKQTEQVKDLEQSLHIEKEEK